MAKHKQNNTGFTMLIAIVVTSILLLVSFFITDLALKQIVISNDNLESQNAFYNADSGVECALYWDLRNTNPPNPNAPISAFDPTTPDTISCGNVVISSGSQTVPTNPPGQSVIGGYVRSVFMSIFMTPTPSGCAIVTVKKLNGVTTIDSRGYNTCDTNSSNRLERGITLTY